MWARYPIAMLVSYFFGIFLIHIWVKKYFDNRGILDYRAADKSADNKQNNIQIDEAGCFEDILEAVFGLLFVVILIIAGLIWLLNVLIDYILFSLLINYLLKKSKSAPLQLSESSFGGFIFKKSLMQVFILVLVVGTGSFFIQHFFPKIQTFGDMFDPVFLKLNKLWFMINS